MPAESSNEIEGSRVRLAEPLLQVGLTVVWSTVRVFGGTSLVVALVQVQVALLRLIEPSTRPVAACRRRPSLARPPHRRAAESSGIDSLLLRNPRRLTALRQSCYEDEIRPPGKAERRVNVPAFILSRGG